MSVPMTDFARSDIADFSAFSRAARRFCSAPAPLKETMKGSPRFLISVIFPVLSWNVKSASRMNRYSTVMSSFSDRLAMLKFRITPERTGAATGVTATSYNFV